MTETTASATEYNNATTSSGAECLGCWYEEQARRSLGELSEARHERLEARRELASVKRAYCLLRKDLIAAQERCAALEKELEAARTAAKTKDAEPDKRAYVDFVARLRRTMNTAPDLLAEEG